MDNLREFVVSTPVGLRISGASVSAALVASRIFRLTGLFASLLPLFAIGGCPPASDTSGNLDSNPTAVLGEIVENSTPGTKFSAQPIVTATFVNQPLTISLPASEGGNAAIELVTAPTLGTLSELTPQSDGSTTVTFTPSVDAVGIAQFNYRIRAEGLASDSATVTIHVYPEVRFQAVGTEEAGLLRIFAQASAPPGYELPEGSYNWGINGGTESGPVSTHFVFERTFSVRRTYLISLTLTLVGFAAPIPCLAGPDGGDPEIEILWGDTDTTGPVESTPIRISGQVLDDAGSGVTDVQVTATGGAQAVTDSTGAYDFTVSSGWSGSITPALQGWVFDPPIRSYSNLTLPITDADFSGKPISGPPDLRVFPPDGVVTSGPRGGVFDPSRFEFLLTNMGTEPLSWSAGKSANWLTLSRTAGTLAPGETFAVVVDLNSAAENLAIGQHVDTLAFTNKTNGLGSTTRSFDLTVTPRPAELISTPSTGLESSGDQGGPFDPTQVVYQLTNSGDESLTWTASKTANWLDVSPSSGTLSAGASASLTVSINANANGLPPGRHEDMVSIVNATNGRGSSTRAIGLDVNPPAGELSVSPSSGLSGSGNQGGPFNPAGKDYTLKNNGGEPITWSATTNGSWFGLSKTTGTLFAGASETLNVSFTAAANSLGSGVYNGKVTITNDTNGSGNTTRNVTLDVNAIPIANAGSDQTIEDTDNNGTESVTLNGSASSDPDGTITNYRWTRGSTELYNGPSSSVTVTLGAGSHSITLTVTDNDGATKSDGVVVTVQGQEMYASSISQYGITWTFDKEYRVGQFVNGDWWVVPDTSGGTVVIAQIDPAPTGTGSNVRNGCKVNPTAAKAQWYDGRAYNKNDSDSLPIILAADNSLVSTISREENCDYGGPYPQTYVKGAAVLTCLAVAPPVESFRPAYCGTNKTIHSAASLRTHLLPKLEPPATAPLMSTVESWIERPWIDHVPGWTGRSVHPLDNMPDYGREITQRIGDASLMLVCDETEIGSKQTLVIRLVQVGIDFYGITQAGGYWPGDGGHSSGRKIAILIAGLMLDHSDMLNIGTSVRFGEDDQTFFVSQEDVDRVLDCEFASNAQGGSTTTITLAASHPNNYSAYVRGNRIHLVGGTGSGQMRVSTAFDTNTRVATVDPPWDTVPDTTTQYEIRGYEADMIGDAMWGIQHVGAPELDNPSWYAPYLELNAKVWYGFVLAARLLGLQDEWGHDALFEFQDARDEKFPVPSGTFRYDMWHMYR